MLLSREREAELLEQNLPKIYRAVDNYMARCNQQAGIQLSYDDCVQEVAVALLQYFRRCETEEQLNTFPWYDALHAMSTHLLRSQPFGTPASTHGFSTIINSIPCTVSYEVLVSRGVDVDGMSKHWVPDEETKLDFDSFMSGQSENMQRIASMRLYGMSYRDIAGQCGISKSAVEKKIKKLRENYNEFDREVSDDE